VTSSQNLDESRIVHHQWHEGYEAFKKHLFLSLGVLLDEIIPMKDHGKPKKDALPRIEGFLQALST